MATSKIDSSSLIDAIDALGPVGDMIEAIFMAATSLATEECSAIQAVAYAATDKLMQAKVILYEIHAMAAAGEVGRARIIEGWPGASPDEHRPVKPDEHRPLSTGRTPSA
jgi:hypothetical protein